MTVKELIEKLQVFDDETEVVVQYRDGGGYYAGTDCNLYLTLVNSTLIL